MKARTALVASVVSLVVFATMTVASFSPAWMLAAPTVQVNAQYALWMFTTAVFILATVASVYAVVHFGRAYATENRQTATCARRLPPRQASARRFAAAAEGHYQGLAQVW